MGRSKWVRSLKVDLYALDSLSGVCTARASMYDAGDAMSLRSNAVNDHSSSPLTLYSQISAEHINTTIVFFFSSRRRHTRSLCDWSSDVCFFFFKQKTAYEITV